MTTSWGDLPGLLGAWWHANQALIGAVGVGVLLGALLYARLTRKGRGRRVKPAVIWLGSNLALLFNAEGTWDILTKRLHQTAGFSLLVFAVFEFALLRAMSLATERYNATCERSSSGVLIRAGHPGKAIYVVWFIALSSGFIVATNAATWTERWLRMVLPITVVLLWWATLTAEGQIKQRGKFAYSPTRLAERWGWLVPDEDPDWQRMAQQRRVRAMATHGHRIHTETGWQRWHTWRLTCLAGAAAGDEVTDACARVDQVVGAVNMIVPRLRPAADPAAPAEQPPTFSVDEIVDQVAARVVERVAALPKPTVKQPEERSAKRPAKPSINGSTPRLTGEQLVAQRVAQVKQAEQAWAVQTPTGPRIGEILNTRSDSVISPVRKQLAADRDEVSRLTQLVKDEYIQTWDWETPSLDELKTVLDVHAGRRDLAPLVRQRLEADRLALETARS